MYNRKNVHSISQECMISFSLQGYAYRIHGSVKDLFTLINSGMAIYAFYANQALLSPNGYINTTYNAIEEIPY